jgi:hypothetical protein
MSKLNHAHASLSVFVCHNPHCMSRRKSFATEKAFTMHFQRSPPCFEFVRQARTKTPSAIGQHRAKATFDDTVFSN